MFLCYQYYTYILSLYATAKDYIFTTPNTIRQLPPTFNMFFFLIIPMRDSCHYTFIQIYIEKQTILHVWYFNYFYILYADFMGVLDRPYSNAIIRFNYM